MYKTDDSSPGAAAAGLQRVVAALGAALVTPAAGQNLATTFEMHLRDLLSLRSVRLREVPTRYQARLVTPTRTSDALVLGVPTTGGRSQAVLEAYFEPGQPPGTQAAALLEAAAQLGGLVLAADRIRHPVPRPADGGPPPLVGSSAGIRELRARIGRIAPTDFTVLVEGESGTGKELVARQLHGSSRRAGGPFVALNCAAIVESLLEAELFGIEDRTATGVRGRRGKFELADGGTLFLDEVSDLSPSAQAKLLRAIQDLAVERVGGHGTRRVDVRIVAATNRPLAGLVEQGVFRPDLFFRFSGVDVQVPPLRARREDIPELVHHFLARHRRTRDLQIADAAVDALQLYAWPGNVRELERVIEHVVALVDTERIELTDLPPRVRGEYAELLAPSMAAGETLRAWGSRYARLVFERCGRNKRRACRALGISYHTLEAYLRFDRHSLRPLPKQFPAWARGPEAQPGTGAEAGPGDAAGAADGDGES